MTKQPRRPQGLSRALGLASGRRPSSRRLASVSHEALRRATPVENVRMGFGPKARRYVKAGAKVTKSTASVSARQAETKRVSKRYGFETPEAATQARKEGAIGYESQGGRLTVIATNEVSIVLNTRNHGEHTTI
jgi:hypothetical protein